MDIITKALDEIAQRTGELNSQIAELNKQRREILAGEFKKIFTLFFETFPQVKGITWTQYTPYFNDGEECIFRVGETYFLSVTPSRRFRYDSIWNQTAAGTDDWSTRWFLTSPKYEKVSKGQQWDKYRHQYVEKFEYNRLDEYEDPRMTKELERAFGQIERMINSMEDVLKDTFGDHCFVVVTPEDAWADHYDHD